MAITAELKEKHYEWRTTDNYTDVQLVILLRTLNGDLSDTKYQETTLTFEYPGSHYTSINVNGVDMDIPPDSPIKIKINGGYERAFLYNLAKNITKALEREISI